jgi:hypothetical protein
VTAVDDVTPEYLLETARGWMAFLLSAYKVSDVERIEILKEVRLLEAESDYLRKRGSAITLDSWDRIPDGGVHRI